MFQGNYIRLHLAYILLDQAIRKKYRATVVSMHLVQAVFFSEIAPTGAKKEA